LKEAIMVDFLLQLVQSRELTYLVAHWLMWELWTCCNFINLLLAMHRLLIMVLADKEEEFQWQHSEPQSWSTGDW
jgi:hypothetical protein